jgi:protein TonB
VVKAELEGAEDTKIIDGVVLPEILTNVDPIYPDLPRRARIEGRVTLACRIKKDGTTGSVHVLSTSNPMFNESALDAVRQRTYTPATRAGEPVEFAFLIRVDFRLRG